MKNSLVIISAFVFLITGCATGYQPKSWNGGYSDMRLGNDIYKVSFQGNESTDSETVYNYYLRRCADLTTEKGFDYFTFVDQSSSSETSIGTINNGTSSQNYSSTEHSRIGLIKLFKNGTQPQVAFEAKEVLKNFKD